MIIQKRYLLIIIVLLTLIPPSAAAKRKFLIDRSHGEFPEEYLYKELRLDLLEDTYDIIESDEAITYEHIQDYDMLFITVPLRDFTSSEVDAVVRFVSNGGGLLLSTGHWLTEPMNSLSQFFGVEFAQRVGVGTITVETQGQSHPVFSEVKRISLYSSSSLRVEAPSEELLHLEGKCIMAYCEYDKGRVFFLTNLDIFLDGFIESLDNFQLVTNIFDWLTEPGGPYVQQQRFLENGIDLAEKGKEQLESGEFSLAESTLNRSKNALEKSLEIYESNTAKNRLRIVISLIEKAETGVTAEMLLQEGRTLFELGEFPSAMSKLEEAQQLFESITSEKSTECMQLIQQCRGEILLNEGVTSFDQHHYEEAKAIFEEARAVYAALQDNQKIEECKDWITSCEEQMTPPETPPEPSEFPTEVIAAVILIVIAIVIIGSVFQLRKRMQKREPEKREQKPAVQTETVTKEELEGEVSKTVTCPVCKNEVQEDWVSCPYCGVRLKDDTQTY